MSMQLVIFKLHHVPYIHYMNSVNCNILKLIVNDDHEVNIEVFMNISR